MKIALLGIGKIAVDQHVPAIETSPDWELAVTVSRHGTVDDVDAFTDLDAMLAERGDVRVVSLCLPPVPRYAAAQSAIKAGRHVMLEKPPGATLSECHALEALARQYRVSLFATWHSREAAGVAGAKAWLADKTLRKMTISWKEDVRRWHPGQDWIWQPGGLGVFDPGINALSIMSEVLPDPIHVSSAVLEVPENCQTPIAATIDFTHPDGAEVQATFDFRQEGEQIWSMTAETDQGTLVLSEGGARLAIDGTEHLAEADLSLTGEYPRLYKRMAELVHQGDIDMDLAPMRHVADAFTLGRRITVDAFVE